MKFTIQNESNLLQYIGSYSTPKVRNPQIVPKNRGRPSKIRKIIRYFRDMWCFLSNQTAI